MKNMRYVALIYFVMSCQVLAKQKVVATFSVLESLAQPLLESGSELTSAIARGQDPHDFKPTPRTALLIKKADVLLMMGYGFDNQIQFLAHQLKSKAKICEVTKGLNVIINPVTKRPDPHVWQSPSMALLIVDNIADCLGSPAELVKQFKSQIQDLHKKFEAEFSRLPLHQKAFVTAHGSFGYLARDYGLKIYSAQELSHEMEPTSQELLSLVKTIRNEKIQALFQEKNISERILQKLSKETSARIRGTLYSDTMSTELEPAGTYLKFLEHNLRQILKGLQNDEK